MLCENCHRNEATCHVCTIVGDVFQSRDLCSECYESSSLEAREHSAAQPDARCEYCGGQPCASGIAVMVTEVPTPKFMCMPCSMEYNRYLQGQLQPLPQDSSRLSQQEQLDFLRQLYRQADEHMRQWVAERGSR